MLSFIWMGMVLVLAIWVGWIALHLIFAVVILAFGGIVVLWEKITRK